MIQEVLEDLEQYKAALKTYIKTHTDAFNPLGVQPNGKLLLNHQKIQELDPVTIAAGKFDCCCHVIDLLKAHLTLVKN